MRNTTLIAKLADINMKLYEVVHAVSKIGIELESLIGSGDIRNTQAAQKQDQCPSCNRTTSEEKD